MGALRVFSLVGIVFLALPGIGCGSSDEADDSQTPAASWIWVAHADGLLSRIWLDDVGTVRSSDRVEDLNVGGGERVVGMDDTYTFAAMAFLTSAGRLLFSSTDPVDAFAPPLVLTGTCFGFTMTRPSYGESLVVSDNGLRIGLDTGPMTASALPAFSFRPGDANEGQAPRLVAVADSLGQGVGAPRTIYGLDADLDILVRHVLGTNEVETVGALGIDATCAACLDCWGGVGYLVTTAAGGTSELYEVNLQTGLATRLGVLGTQLPVVDLAVNGYLFPPV